MKKILNFIIIGPQGCGKGTQAALLMRHFKYLHNIATGNLFRKLTERNSDAGRRVKKIVNSGGLPLDDIAITLWSHDILYNVRENNGILLDGAPRRPSEVDEFDKLIKFLDRKNSTFVIFIHISKRESFNRLTKRRQCVRCGQIIPWIGKYKTLNKCDKCNGNLAKRTDDDEKEIKTRLNLYQKKTVPAIKLLAKRGYLILKINGEQGIENVFRDILKAIRNNDKIKI